MSTESRGAEIHDRGIPQNTQILAQKGVFLSNLQPIFTAQEISSAVERLANEVRVDYYDKNPLLIGVLKGAFMFMADLIRYLDIPLEVEFVTMSSYGQGRTETSGKVKVVQGLCAPISGRHVLVVEDIVDVGQTLKFFVENLHAQNPASVKVCTLFDKPSRRQVHVDIDYLGLTVPNVFVVGYGLDYDEKYRNLPGLYALSEK